MKRLFQFLIIVAAAGLMFSSCSTPKDTMASQSAVSRGKFTGTWTITDISYDGILANAVTNVFDQAPPADFKGSTWKLTNSGNGIYTLPNGTSQTIFWSVYNSDPTAQMFQFKKLYEGDKAKNVDTGYRLIIAGNNGNTMTLKTAIDYGGKTGYIIYTFTK